MKRFIRLKRFIAILLFATAIVCLFSNVFADNMEGNLLYNGNFEILDEDGLPEGWFIDAYHPETGYSSFSAVEYEDEHSRVVRIRNLALNDARFAQDIEVEPDSVYCLSGYVLADNVQEGRGANLSIEGVYAFSESFYDTDQDWEYIEYYGRTGPDQHVITVYARLGGYSGESKGAACFDDLCLIKADSVPDDTEVDAWYSGQNSDDYDEDDDEIETSVGGPVWPWLLVIGAVYVWVVISLIRFYKDGSNSSALIKEQSGSIRMVPFLFLALGLRIFVSYFVTGYMVDVNCFTSWGLTMAQYGPAKFYQTTNFCDYPPLYTYVLGANSMLSQLAGNHTEYTRIIFRLLPSFCDVAACYLIYLTAEKLSKSKYHRLMLIILAFNPATVLNSAAWGQMDSVLCLLLLLVVIFALRDKWIYAIPAYVLAVLVKPQALMLGFLGLAMMILRAVRKPKTLLQMLWGTLIGIGLAFLLVILPFGILAQQEPGWLIQLYSSTLQSYPYTTLNTANFFYIASGNWTGLSETVTWPAPLFFAFLTAQYGILWLLPMFRKKGGWVESSIGFSFSVFFILCLVFRWDWGMIGTGSMAFAFVIVLSLAIRKNDIRFLSYLGALLFILLYVFGVKMHERYLFPALFLLALSWDIHRDRRILYLLLLFSFTLFVNEGIILDNSIRLGSKFGHLNQDTIWLADILSVLNIHGALYAVFLGFRIAFGAGPGSYRLPPAFLPIRKYKEKRKAESFNPDPRLHWNAKDTVILAVTTLLFASLSLTTLGSTKAPQTFWSSSEAEETIVFDVGENYEDYTVLYFGQVSYNDFSLAQSYDNINWSEEVTAQMDQGQCWKWKYVTQWGTSSKGNKEYYNDTAYILHFSCRYVRLTAGQVGLKLNEIIFRDTEGHILPAKIVSHRNANTESPLCSDPANLLDEQDTLEGLPTWLGTQQAENIGDEQVQAAVPQPSWWNSTYFDEIYHARTGFEFLNGSVPYETSHPPLGKLLMTVSIAIFGMTPFGWRFAGALAGILMLPGIYLLAKQLTKKTWIASVCTALMALDCLHMTQSQIATIDSFPVLFIIFAFFFMLRFFQTDLLKTSFIKILAPLCFSGIFMGLSIASKWIGVYAGIGLAAVFFWNCLRQINLHDSPVDQQRDRIIKRVFLVSICCIGFFILIPLAIYLLSYIPYMAYNTRIKSIGDYLSAVWAAQQNMLSYHSKPGLGMDHPFYSPWWEWPVIGKPMYYASASYMSGNLRYSIFAIGNPVIWWSAIGTMLYLALRFICAKRYQIEGQDQRWHLLNHDYNARYAFILLGFLAQYLPWVLVPRGTYIYHYFASVPFLILSVGLVFDDVDEFSHRLMKIISIIFVSFALLFFVLFYPYVSGMAVPKWWLDIGKYILHVYYTA